MGKTDSFGAGAGHALDQSSAAATTSLPNAHEETRWNICKQGHICAWYHLHHVAGMSWHHERIQVVKSCICRNIVLSNGGLLRHGSLGEGLKDVMQNVDAGLGCPPHYGSKFMTF
uniref:Uncharacterized protein n=1 Tax=Zea mays TaxID=4577 RepID=A0A804UER5_MAIZE